MKKFYFLILLSVFSFPDVFAQKIVRVEGTAQVKMERNMTLEETQGKAKELAMIDAIEKAFGTYAEQQFDMRIEDGKTSYNTIGTTKVVGDWIETIGAPRYEDDFRIEDTPSGKQKIRWVTCYIKGKARKIVPKANIEFEPLNMSDPAARTTEFYDGEQLYLWFKSPVNGYVSVFLDDGDTVYRLLPYSNMDNEFQSGVFVKGDRSYIFFSESDNSLKIKENDVDEVYLWIHNSYVEFNYLYVIFSEDHFVKPILSPSDTINNKILPKSLNPDRFQKWLAHNRAASTSFQDNKVKISIQPKKN